MDNKDELYHYGVLGMKWGSHRYAKQEGTYIKKGISIFNKKMSEYESANQKVKSLKGGDKSAYKSAKSERKVAKQQLDASYKQLKKDSLADKGKNLYQQGKTIGGNLKVNAIAQGVIVLGSRIANPIIAKYAKSQQIANIATSTIAIGGTAVNAVLAIKTGSQNKKLRAYYGHSRPVK